MHRSCSPVPSCHEDSKDIDEEMDAAIKSETSKELSILVEETTDEVAAKSVTNSEKDQEKENPIEECCENDKNLASIPITVVDHSKDLEESELRMSFAKVKIQWPSGETEDIPNSEPAGSSFIQRQSRSLSAEPAHHPQLLFPGINMSRRSSGVNSGATFDSTKSIPSVYNEEAAASGCPSNRDTTLTPRFSSITDDHSQYRRSSLRLPDTRSRPEDSVLRRYSGTGRDRLFRRL